MYGGCEEDEADNNSFTKAEWDKLKSIFKSSSVRTLIEALERTDNSPQDVASFSSRFRTGSLGGMNSTLLRRGMLFRFDLVYEGGFFRENQIYLKRVVLPKPKIVETRSETFGRCC